MIDTYHTINSGLNNFNSNYLGILNFILVAMALQDAGCDPKGVRLDSGDLAVLSKYLLNLKILILKLKRNKENFNKLFRDFKKEFLKSINSCFGFNQ